MNDVFTWRARGLTPRPDAVIMRFTICASAASGQETPIVGFHESVAKMRIRSNTCRPRPSQPSTIAGRWKHDHSQCRSNMKSSFDVEDYPLPTNLPVVGRQQVPPTIRNWTRLKLRRCLDIPWYEKLSYGCELPAFRINENIFSCHVPADGPIYWCPPPDVLSPD